MAKNKSKAATSSDRKSPGGGKHRAEEPDPKVPYVHPTIAPRMVGGADRESVRAPPNLPIWEELDIDPPPKTSSGGGGGVSSSFSLFSLPSCEPPVLKATVPNESCVPPYPSGVDYGPTPEFKGYCALSPAEVQRIAGMKKGYQTSIAELAVVMARGGEDARYAKSRIDNLHAEITKLEKREGLPAYVRKNYDFPLEYRIGETSPMIEYSCKLNRGVPQKPPGVNSRWWTTGFNNPDLWASGALLGTASAIQDAFGKYTLLGKVYGRGKEGDITDVLHPAPGFFDSMYCPEALPIPPIDLIPFSLIDLDEVVVFHTGSVILQLSNWTGYPTPFICLRGTELLKFLLGGKGTFGINGHFYHFGPEHRFQNKWPALSKDMKPYSAVRLDVGVLLADGRYPCDSKKTTDSEKYDYYVPPCRFLLHFDLKSGTYTEYDVLSTFATPVFHNFTSVVIPKVEGTTIRELAVQSFGMEFSFVSIQTSDANINNLISSGRLLVRLDPDVRGSQGPVCSLRTPSDVQSNLGKITQRAPTRNHAFFVNGKALKQSDDLASHTARVYLSEMEAKEQEAKQADRYLHTE